MHREPGYKRFFNNTLLFYLGLNLILLAGNFETLFVGWEIIGASSFFLISFYRERYIPSKNALKVVSIYRIADIFLLFAIWLSHHYFEKSINFVELKSIEIPTFEIKLFVITLLLMIVASVKSAQFPFSFWLPRAMEGPTVSSAIFYGSLSVHIGLFLLLRIYPLWQENTIFRIIVIIMGLVNIIICTLISEVQSSIKSQIAYASIIQIGIIFIEIALGFHTLALIHFAGNSFLRTYQLLISPSFLNYLIHDQFYSFIKPQNFITDNFIGKIKSTLYILSIKEFNMDSFMYHYIWKNIKKLGYKIHFVNYKVNSLIITTTYITSLYFLFNRENISKYIIKYIPILIIIIALIIGIKAFVKRDSALRTLFLLMLSQLYIGLSISFNERFYFKDLLLFFSGIIISFIIGYFSLNYLKSKNKDLTLNLFHGYANEFPFIAFLFVIATLGISGFPITPTFVGEDIILGYIHENQILLSLLTAFNLIINGLTAFRIYSRVFNGIPRYDYYIESHYRSS
jgi:NADH:ubiquinone oxidoreductase subunit 5 (subunit L)/multisubunit Na+/H+ antiporter MnhA subunit